MTFSLIVATCGRERELRALLESLESQDFRDFEVVVVDQNEALDISGLLSGWSFPLRHLRSPRGASCARNAGLQVARGEVVAFPDDDCAYRSDTLAKAADFFRANPDAGALVAKWKPCRRERLGRYGVFRRAGTCFFFVRKVWADRIGGFDEAFGPGPAARFPGGEDTDYLIRGLDAGMRIVREPEVVVLHPDMPCGSVSRQKVRAYGVARMALLRKHRYACWFKLLNVLYPLAALALKPAAAGYFAAMARGRLQGLLSREGAARRGVVSPK